MFIFQHISSFISLIHPLSAVFISEETECRTFVIENKSISFSIFNYQFLIIKSMALKLQRVPSDQPYQERRAGESVRHGTDQW